MLNYKVEGKGYPILFLHGFLESNSMWRYLALHELKRQLVFVDLPGHGYSDVLESLPPSISSIAEKVLEVTDFLGLKQFSIVGHSMGGYVALEMKHLRPDIEKVVLLNSNPWSDSPQKVLDRQRVASIVYKAKDLFLKEAIPNLFNDPLKTKIEVDELIQEASSITNDGIAFASLAMSSRKDYSEHVLSDANYYIIQGEKDNIVPRDAMDALFKSKTNYFLIREAGHMAHIEQPSEVLRILKQLLIE